MAEVSNCGCNDFGSNNDIWIWIIIAIVVIWLLWGDNWFGNNCC